MLKQKHSHNLQVFIQYTVTPSRHPIDAFTNMVLSAAASHRHLCHHGSNGSLSIVLPLKFQSIANWPRAVIDWKKLKWKTPCNRADWGCTIWPTIRRGFQKIGAVY